MPGEFGSTAPAMVAPQQKGGKDMRGKVVAGLAMELLAIALPMLSQSKGQDGRPSEDAVAVSDAYNKLLKHFAKPPADLGQSELKFMQSQLYPVPRPPAMDSGQGIRQSLAGMGVQPGAPGGAQPPTPAPAMAG